MDFRIEAKGVTPMPATHQPDLTSLIRTTNKEDRFKFRKIL